ncbi:hypothetical protein CRM22_001809, partial [Opisthorchis felineus]
KRGQSQTCFTLIGQLKNNFYGCIYLTIETFRLQINMFQCPSFGKPLLILIYVYFELALQKAPFADEQSLRCMPLKVSHIGRKSCRAGYVQWTPQKNMILDTHYVMADTYPIAECAELCADTSSCVAFDWR